MCASIPIHYKGTPPSPMIKHWAPPPQGKYKVNVDVVVFKEQGCCGIGVVIRNDQRQLMGVMCKKVDFLLGVLEAEAKVAEAAILLAWDLGLKDIVVEGDSQLVIQALNSSNPPALPILKIVEGLKRCLLNFNS